MNREKNILFLLKMWRIVWRNDQASTVINTQLMNVEKCFVYICSCSAEKLVRSLSASWWLHFCKPFLHSILTQSTEIYALCHSAVLCSAVLCEVMLCQLETVHVHTRTHWWAYVAGRSEIVSLYSSRWWNAHRNRPFYQILEHNHTHTHTLPRNCERISLWFFEFWNMHTQPEPSYTAFGLFLCNERTMVIVLDRYIHNCFELFLFRFLSLSSLPKLYFYSCLICNRWTNENCQFARQRNKKPKIFSRSFWCDEKEIHLNFLFLELYSISFWLVNYYYWYSQGSRHFLCSAHKNSPQPKSFIRRLKSRCGLTKSDFAAW